MEIRENAAFNAIRQLFARTYHDAVRRELVALINIEEILNKVLESGRPANLRKNEGEEQ